MRLRLGASFLVGTLLFAGLASASLAYRCPMERVTQRSCCCPPAETAVETPTVTRGCCQAVELRATAPSPSESVKVAPERVAPPALTPGYAPPVIVLVPALPGSIEDPPATGPPLVVSKQSFLI